MTRQSVTLHSTAVDVDLRHFEEDLDLVAAHGHVALGGCSSCLGRMEKAVDHYIGEFLAGFHVEDADPFVEWQTIQRERTHQRALTALQDLALAFGARSDYARMRDFATRQVTLEPWRGSAPAGDAGIGAGRPPQRSAGPIRTLLRSPRARVGRGTGNGDHRTLPGDPRWKPQSAAAPVGSRGRARRVHCGVAQLPPVLHAHPRPRGRDSAGVGLPRPAVDATGNAVGRGWQRQDAPVRPHRTATGQKRPTTTSPTASTLCRWLR
ncbi:MAG: bacterial transcriptional activator domain-containing protein [Caldilineaceae bacterium]